MVITNKVLDLGQLGKEDYNAVGTQDSKSSCINQKDIKDIGDIDESW